MNTDTDMTTVTDLSAETTAEATPMASASAAETTPTNPSSAPTAPDSSVHAAQAACEPTAPAADTAAPSAASPSKDTPADIAATANAIAGIQASINSFGPAVAAAVFSAVPNGVTADFPPKTGLVRRLTPVETCRLMGFPDDYLDVDGPETKDAPRYKACGNSWAVNCAEFVNTRVERALREEGVVKDGDPVRYATTCSGVEAHSLSVRDGHWQAKFFSEIEPFPCRVLAHRYPDVPNLGDMTVLDGTKYALDVFSGGTPCQSLSVAGKRHGMAEGSGTRSSLAFHWLRIAVEAGAKIALWENVCFGAGTLVTTDHGHRKIEDVKVGDRVRSIDGKLHRVEKVMATKGKNTVTLRVMGADDITVTPNHPFYVRMKNRLGKFSAPEWLPAGVLAKDCYVAYKIDAPGKETIGLANAYAVGRWLADGSITLRAENGRNGSRNGQMARIFISTGLKKRDSLAKELARLPYAIRESKVKDYAVNFSFTSDAFYGLIKDCGKGARNKVVPEYVYSLIPEEQAELLRGYLDGDGSRHRRTEMTYCSSSRELAMGIARLVRDVYQRGVSMRFVKKPETVEIEGRTVKAHDSWVCSFSLCPASQSKNGSFEEDGFVWCPVRSVTKGEKQTVYNLTVADLHTYEANDVVVHNCGAFTVNGGRDFAWFVFRLIEAGWGVAWRVLDAQFTSSWRFPRAIPQRRRRIWLVAVRDGDWQLASRILFERTAKTGLRPPVRVLGDGTVVDDDEDTQTRLRFFTRASRADWLPKDFFGGPGVSLTDVRARRAIGQLGEIRYLGGMFAQPDLFGFGGEETPECIDSAFLDALGAGSGIAVGRNVCVLQSALWPAGIQPTCAALAAANGDAAAVEPSPAYDGTLCGLSDVLLPWNDDLIRFVLSIRACAGIIRRADARGKELRPILTEALGGQIACWANGLLDPYLAKSGKSDAEDEEEESEDDLDLDENGLPCSAEGDGEGGEYEEAQ